MNPTDLRSVARWCGAGRTQLPAGIAVRGAAIDSRAVQPGDLFFALRGGRCDGHDFLPEAFRRGAAAAVVERSPSRLGASVRSRPLLVVADAEEALVRIARSYRPTLSLLAAAVTGSNGKTTTKTLLGALLGTAMKTLISPRSYNNRLGVSLTVLALDRSHRAAVFELGMNHPGEIRELGRICRPAAGAILNVGPAHLGQFATLDAIARAKGELIPALFGRRLLALNIDDPRVARLGRRFSGEAVTFGLSPWAAVRAERIELSVRGAAFDLVLEDSPRRVRSPLPGLHNVYNLLAAAALAVRLGVPRAAIRRALPRLRLPPMRWETFRAGGALIVNDAYNANPASMRAALAAFRALPVSGKRIVVSGDMNELGPFAPREHRRWGAELAEAAFDRLVFVGELSRDAAEGALKAGAGRGSVVRCPDRAAALAALAGAVAAGDAVLIKGSRIMGLDELAERLVERLGRKGR